MRIAALTLALAFGSASRAATVGVSSGVVSAESDLAVERYAEAGAKLEPIVRERPGDARAALDLALSYHGSGRYDEEIRLLERTLVLRPGLYELDVQLAKAYLSLGRLSQAKEAFARAKKADGRASEAYIQEGYARLMAGDTEAARAEFEHLIAVDTANPWGYYHMGGYYGRAGRGGLPRSEHFFRLALETARAAPGGAARDLLPFLLSLGDALIAEERFADAESLYRGALEDPRQIRTDCSRRRLERELGALLALEAKPEEAETAFRHAVNGQNSCRDQPVALLQFALFEEDRGRAAAAKTAAEESFASFAGFDTLAHLAEFDRLAAALADAGDAARAEALYRKVIAACASLPAGAVRARDEDVSFAAASARAELGLGGLAEAAGRWTDAEDRYRRAADGFRAAGRPKGEASAREKEAEARRKARDAER